MEEQRMAEDPAYAAEVIAKRKAANKKRCEQRKAELAAWKEAAANGDEDAAKKLEARRAYYSKETTKCRKKMYDEAEAGNPEAVQRYNEYLQDRRDNYYRQKEKKQEKAGEAS